MFQLDIKVFFKYLRGILFGIAVTFLCLMICAFVLSRFPVDRAFAAPLATICLAIGSFFAAFDVAYHQGQKGYVIGLIIGIVFFLLTTCAGMLIREGHFTRNTIFHFIIILLMALIGGICGVGKKEKKKFI